MKQKCLKHFVTVAHPFDKLLALHNHISKTKKNHLKNYMFIINPIHCVGCNCTNLTKLNKHLTFKKKK